MAYFDVNLTFFTKINIARARPLGVLCAFTISTLHMYAKFLLLNLMEDLAKLICSRFASCVANTIRSLHIECILDDV